MTSILHKMLRKSLSDRVMPEIEPERSKGEMLQMSSVMTSETERTTKVKVIRSDLGGS